MRPRRRLRCCNPTAIAALRDAVRGARDYDAGEAMEEGVALRQAAQISIVQFGEERSAGAGVSVAG